MCLELDGHLEKDALICEHFRSISANKRVGSMAKVNPQFVQLVACQYHEFEKCKGWTKKP